MGHQIKMQRLAADNGSQTDHSMNVVLFSQPKGDEGNFQGAGDIRKKDILFPHAKPAEFKRKIKLGVIGGGGRGSWITRLFQRHGGYVIHAVADYFPEVANAAGDAFGVDKARRFSTRIPHRSSTCASAEDPPRIDG